METVGILHPGAMGSSVGAAARASAKRVVWASEGRSATTAERARRAGLVDVGSLKELVGQCELIVSACPPEAASELAVTIAGAGFSGLYVDANAISPETSVRISRAIEAAGGRFVDGGIVGPPAWNAGTTRLYLSGELAEQVVAVFRGSHLEPIVVGDEAGKASALKMLYAAYTKGTAALLAAILTAAEAHGIRKALQDEWKLSLPGVAETAVPSVCKAAPKAWRFVGEMREVASTFCSVGLPVGFHVAAEEIYRRQVSFKDRRAQPEIEEVLSTLLGGP